VAGAATRRYHTAARLLRRVIVIDNLNVFYDPGLKWARLD
jgi:hypothetical protein